MSHTCKETGMTNCKPCMEWRLKLWDAINEYVVSCGGDPDKYVYGNTPRMSAVVDIERCIIQASSNDQIR